MKSFCRECGKPVSDLANRKRRFCDSDCYRKFNNQKAYAFSFQSFYSIEKRFNLFKNIVAASDSYPDFCALFEEYFPYSQIVDKETAPDEK